MSKRSIPKAVGVKATRRFEITDEGVAAAGFEGGHECGEVLFREFVGVVCGLSLLRYAVRHHRGPAFR
jgi:hypothetical protein